MEDNYKEVYFYQYCDTCKYCKLKETEEPCDSCLAETANLCSHKPIHWEEKNKNV